MVGTGLAGYFGPREAAAPGGLAQSRWAKERRGKPVGPVGKEKKSSAQKGGKEIFHFQFKG